MIDVLFCVIGPIGLVILGAVALMILTRVNGDFPPPPDM